jgi:hypothetical protein
MSEPATTPVQPVKRHGCFFYGCITCIVLVLIVAITGFFAVRYGLNKFAAFVERYTETAPMALPKTQMAEAEYQSLDKRVTAFADALRARKPVPPLELNSDEINALIANQPDWKQLKGKVFVKIEDDKITGQVSLPMDDIANRVPGLSRLKGRFLNGSAAFKVSLTNGLLSVTLQSVEVKGQSPSGQTMAALKSVNFAQNATQDPKTAEALAKLESVEVKDGKLVVTPKVKE